MSVNKKNVVVLFLVACVALWAAVASATSPYVPVAPGSPGLGKDVAKPAVVPGKEYSHNLDLTTTGGGGILSPEQVIAWDGSGGTADGLNFVGTRPSFTQLSEMDAIANHGDFLYSQVLSDDAHLVFSVDDTYTLYAGGAAVAGTVPSAGPVTLANGNVIGGAGELSVEKAVYGGANPADTQMLWAAQTSVNNSPVPRDVDGVELWGPEPGFKADTDKYSLDFDMLSYGAIFATDAVSVWNGTGSPYIPLSRIAAAVNSLLPPNPDGGPPLLPDQVNLDALMVQDVVGSPDEFERNPLGGASDSIIFSIRQIPDGAGGYLATGSELFVLDAAGGASYLKHGGHTWDHSYALSTFNVWKGSPDNFGVIDINAIEAVGENVVPEPASLLLLLTALIGLAHMRRPRAHR